MAGTDELLGYSQDYGSNLQPSAALRKPSARVRISSLLPDWATSNGGEGGIGYATLRASAPSLRLSVPLRSTNSRLGFASHPSYLIGLRPMAEREGFEPSVELPPHILSRDAQSATLSPLLGKWLNKLTVALRSIEIDFLDNYLLKWDVDSPMDRL
jgi:hypothetical protein